MDLERKFSRPDVEAILRSKKAICQGYSQLFAALCEKAQIPCEIISGYAKKTSAEKPALSEQDHAWNAVLIDDQWQLLDLTWASGIARQPAAFPLNQPDDYFFTPPVKFLTTHLPADPLWQLLDCPLTPSQFQEAEDQTEALLATNTDCISFRDSINALQQLPLHERRLLTAVNAWKFNPTDKNAKELGQLYMDQFVRLSEVEEGLQQTDSLGTLLEVQRELFFLADEAQKYTSLYDWQKENLAYIYLNFGVGLSMDLMNLEDPDTTINTLRQMEQSLLKTEEILAQVPANFLTEQAQKRCSDYLGYVRENLEAYRR